MSDAAQSSKEQMFMNRNRRDIINYHGSRAIVFFTFIAIVIASIVQCYFVVKQVYPTQAVFFLLLFSFITILLFLIFFLKKRREPHYCFTTIFLLSTFTMLITWRISVLIAMPIVSYIFLAAFVAKVVNYIICARNDLSSKQKRTDRNFCHNSKYEWQLLFVRLVIGFIFVPHFTEKLFAGSAVRLDDVHAFVSLGVPHALFFVYCAGVLEFCSCLSIGCGFLTRFGAVGAFMYLMVASFLGHHFTLGFIWASPGGGWEYPMLWGALLLSFASFGGDGFSLDHALKDAFKLPRWVRFIMG